MSGTAGMVSEAAGRLFADEVDRSVREQAAAGAWPDRLWRAIEAAGLTRPMVPEHRGGHGADWESAYEIARAAGRHALPAPLADTMIGSWLLDQARLPVPAGPIVLASDGATLHLARDGDGWMLRGVLARVPWGRFPVTVVTAVGHAGVGHVAAFESGRARATPAANLAGEPRDRLAIDGAAVAVAPFPSVPDIRHLGAAVRAAQMAGAASAVLEMAVRYAGERVQFGRPIARFQAIRNQIARLAAEVAAADCAARAAFAALAQAGGDVPAAMAKLTANRAAAVAIAVGHQVHGAIGFTLEYPLHPCTRRLMAWRSEFGGESAWAAELGTAALAQGQALWAWMADSGW